MNNLIFCLDAIAPVFLLMVLGYLLNRTPLLPDDLAEKLNEFVFKLALPVQLFKSLYTQDFSAVWDGGAVLFCFIATALSIAGMMLLSLMVKQELRAEFIQAGYRSSQALLGVALMTGLYGETGPLALILIGAVPLYNVAAVVLLTLMVPGGKLNRTTWKKTIRGIVTNPIILAIVAGLIWSFFRLPTVAVADQIISYLAGMAIPLGLLALGASINFKRAAGVWKPTLAASACKLILFPALFLPVAVYLGYRGELLAAILLMLGTSTTVSSFNMARSMGHDGTLTAGTVMLTTVLCSFTMTGWLFFLRTGGLL